MNATVTYFNTNLKEIPTIQLTRLHFNGNMSDVSIDIHGNEVWLNVNGPIIGCCAVRAKMIHPMDLRAYSSPEALEHLRIITFQIRGIVYSYAINIYADDLDTLLERHIKPVLRAFIKSDYELGPDDLINVAVGSYIGFKAYCM